MDLQNIATIVTPLIVAIFIAFIKYRDAIKEKKDKNIRELTEKTFVMILSGMTAIGELSLQSSVSLQTGKVNGELKQAQKDFEAWQKEMRDLKDRTLSNYIK